MSLRKNSVYCLGSNVTLKAHDLIEPIPSVVILFLSCIPKFYRFITSNICVLIGVRGSNRKSFQTRDYIPLSYLACHDVSDSHVEEHPLSSLHGIKLKRYGTLRLLSWGVFMEMTQKRRSTGKQN